MNVTPTFNFASFQLTTVAKTNQLRATSHVWDWEPVTITLQAPLIVGKGGAGPSSLHTTLEGPTEYVNARWMWSLHGFLHGIKWTMFRGHLDYFQKPSLGGRLEHKTGRTWHSERSQPLIYSILSCGRTHMNINSLKKHLVENPVTYGFTLHLRIDDHTTWFWRCVGTAFGHFLLGSHNFMVTALGSCEVALRLGSCKLDHGGLVVGMYELHLSRETIDRALIWFC